MSGKNQMHFCRKYNGILALEYQGWITEILVMLVNNCAQALSHILQTELLLFVVCCILMFRLSSSQANCFEGPDVQKELTYFVLNVLCSCYSPCEKSKHIVNNPSLNPASK